MAFAAAGTMVFAALSVQADTLDAVLKVGESRHTAAINSQKKIDKLADEARDLLSDYKTVMKQVDGLKVYNSRLERQISNQEKRVAQIEDSISQVTVIQRQIMPLLLRMLDSLEQFVALDAPFHNKERQERMAFLRDNVDRSDLSLAEKFRQVLEAYKIESEYGRKIDTYKDTINIGGVDREVNILRVGRIALMYQTTDQTVTGRWNAETRQWEQLDSGTYRNAVTKGIKIANKQASVDILKLPIAAPEAQ